MTCKDCIHSEVCYKKNDYDNFPDVCGEFALENIQTPTVFIYSEDDMYAGGGYTECDNCKQRFSNAGFPMIHDAKFCPDCGAKVFIKR